MKKHQCLAAAMLVGLVMLARMPCLAQTTSTFGVGATGTGGQVERAITKSLSIVGSISIFPFGLEVGLRNYVFEVQTEGQVIPRPFTQVQFLFVASESEDYGTIIVGALTAMGIKLIIQARWVIEGYAGTGWLSIREQSALPGSAPTVRSRQVSIFNWRLGVGWIF